MYQGVVFAQTTDFKGFLRDGKSTIKSGGPLAQQIFASRTDATLLRGRTRRNTTVNFAGEAAPGDLVPVLIEGATSTTLRGRIASLVAA